MCDYYEKDVTGKTPEELGRLIKMRLDDGSYAAVEVVRDGSRTLMRSWEAERPVDGYQRCED